MAKGESFRKIAVEEHWGNRDLAEVRMAYEARKKIPACVNPEFFRTRMPRLGDFERARLSYWYNAANLLGVQ